jgi:hypothetical protein
MRCLRVAGEMNFAPTTWVETSENEAFEGAGEMNFAPTMWVKALEDEGKICGGCGVVLWIMPQILR